MQKQKLLIRSLHQTSTPAGDSLNIHIRIRWPSSEADVFDGVCHLFGFFLSTRGAIVRRLVRLRRLAIVSQSFVWGKSKAAVDFYSINRLIALWRRKQLQIKAVPDMGFKISRLLLNLNSLNPGLVTSKTRQYFGAKIVIFKEKNIECFWCGSNKRGVWKTTDSIRVNSDTTFYVLRCRYVFNAL